MDNSKIDSNIKLILDLRSNKGVFPLSSESAIIAHSPNGEMTYLDSVIDYLYQQVAYKIRLYTELDGNNTKGKAYPAAMGLRDSNNITSLQNSVNSYASLVSSLQLQVNNIDQTDAIVSLNTIVALLQEEFNTLMTAAEYSYLEIKFSDSTTRPPGNLDNTTYWKDAPLTNYNHLWLGIRTVTVRRGPNGEAIVTKGPATVVSLQGPKGEKGDRGEPGPPGIAGTTGQDGDTYIPVLMYKWTNSRTTVPTTPEYLALGWSEHPGSPLGNNKYLWMTQNFKKTSDNTYLNEHWTTPVCLSGEDGAGADGTGIEFIFYRTNNKGYIPSVASINAYSTGTAELQSQFLTNNFPFIDTDEANIISGNAWTDNPQGIEANAKYEWASFRESREGEWGNFCSPFRWSVWGEDGIDGDGVEYIYYLSDTLKEEDWRADRVNMYDDTDPRNWSGDANFQQSGYIRDNTNWHNVPTGVSTDYPYEYVSVRRKNGTNKIWGYYSRPVLWSKYGKDGAAASAGLNGSVVRFRGEYTPNTAYVNESLDITKPANAIRYIDVVMVTAANETSYYMVKSLLDDTRITTVSPTASGLNDWQQATGFSFIAAESLYARDAHINDLSTYEFVVQDGENHIVAGMTGGNVTDSVVNSNNNSDSNPVRIWAGSNTGNNINLLTNDIPFKVFQNGKLKATNALIKGDLSLDSLSLTGNLGSYYYNEEEITLPQILDSSKHTVTFIITTFNATEVSAYSGDVLFALSDNTITTTSSAVALDKYKIYLAISINDGGTKGWLILNLNSLQIINNHTSNLYSAIISENSSTWTVSNNGLDTSNGSIPLILLAANLPLCTFTTVNTSAYSNVNNKKFSLNGKIYCKYGNNIIATITISPKNITYVGNNALNSISSGTVTMKDILTNYAAGEITVETLNLVNAPITYIDSPDNTYLQVSWGDVVNISSGDPITIEPHISLTESFTYTTQTTNHANPTTTTVVGSNGFVIKDGSIVATDMPEGASVNMKDCIVYKDVTEVATNAKYEVVNFGASDITIGNTILNPTEAILVKALPNIQIDFSDITAIDASDIYDIDPVEPTEPVNH